MSSGNAAFEAGQAAGRAVGMMLPLIIGVVWSLVLRRRRGDGTFPALPATIGLVVTLLGLLGLAMGSRS